VIVKNAGPTTIALGLLLIKAKAIDEIIAREKLSSYLLHLIHF